MEDTDYDYTLQSLDGNVKALLDRHQEDARSSSETPEGQSSPMTVLQAGDNRIGDGASGKLNAVDDADEKVGRRRYISVTEMSEENAKLKAEVFNLKSYIYVLKKDLPFLRNAKADEVTSEYLRCKAQLSDEKKAKLNLEAELEELKNQLEDFKSSSQLELKRIREENKSLTAQLKQVRESENELRSELEVRARTVLQLKEDLREAQSVSTCESDVSQGGSSMFSVLSERDQQLEEVKGKMYLQKAEFQKLATDFSNQVAKLNADLNKKSDETKLLAGRLEEEKLRFDEIKANCLRLGNLLDDLGKEKEILQKDFEAYKAKSEEEVLKRDKAIMALVKHVKESGSAGSAKTPKEFSDAVPKMPPPLADFLYKSEKIDEKNVELREKMIQWATTDGSYEDKTASSSILSTDDEISETSLARFMKKNEKNAKFIQVAQSVVKEKMEDSVRKEVEQKMKLFDAIGDDDLSHKELPSHLLNISAPGDLLNASRFINREVETLKKKLAHFRSICIRLFEKLQGSTKVFQSVLEQLYGKGEGNSIIVEVEAMGLDLNQSLNAANVLLDSVQIVQKSILEFTEVFERSARLQLSESLVNVDASTAAVEHDGMLGSLTNEILEAERKKVADANDEINALLSKVNALESDKKECIARQEAAEKDLAELIVKLEQVTAKSDEANNKCEVLLQEITLLHDNVKEKDLEMKKMIKELSKKETDLAQYKAYFEEISRVEEESKKLMQSLKETIPRRIVEIVSGKIKVSAEDQAAKVAEADPHVIRLREEYAQMRVLIDESASKFAIYDAKLQKAVEEANVLKKEKNELESKLNRFENKVKNTRSCITETDMTGADIERKEAELERYKMEASVSKQNMDKVCAAFSELENKRTKIPVKMPQRQVHPANKYSNDFISKKSGTMTDLRLQDIETMEKNLADCLKFVDDIYSHFFQKKSGLLYDVQQSLMETELESLKYDIIKVYNSYLEKEREYSKNALNQFVEPARICGGINQSLSSEVSDYRNSEASKCDDDSSKCLLTVKDDVAADSTGEVPYFLSDFSSKFWKRLFGSANDLVQLVKSQQSQNTVESANKVLVKSRYLREKIHDVQKHVSQLENRKENVIPKNLIGDLRQEVVRLKSALSSANKLLEEADHKLEKQANNDPLRKLIINEMANIRDILKMTRLDVLRLEEH